MSASKKKCAKCAKSEGSLKACSNCHLVSYCTRDCQKSDWKKHTLSCRLNSDITFVFRKINDQHGSEAETGMDFIFDTLTGAVQEAAIDTLIQYIKEQRRVDKHSNDFFGVADHCRGLCAIYLKMKHFTEAKSQIDKCAHYVKMIDQKIVNDPIARSNTHLLQLKASMDWNRLIAETPLLTMANESEMKDVEQMPIGPDRRDRTYAIVTKYFQEQNNCLKIANLHQCFKIDLHCIGILHAILNEESGNLVKTRKLLANRMTHAQSMISEHGPKLDKESVDALNFFQKMFDIQKSFTL